jgi:hypothetical protein
MRVVSAAEIDGALTFPKLIEALEEAFRGDIVVPARHHHEIVRAGSPATLLLMPAWTGAAAADGFVGVKIVSVFPENGRRGLPSVLGTYLLMDGATGEPRAALDGTRLTHWRTAAASALAAGYLARHGVRSDGSRLLSRSDAKRVNAVMLTSGTYDAAGEFAYRVGLPGKSGVGGGIVAVIPNRCTLCAWSPRLDSAGNSIAAVDALDAFTTITGWSIF